jgi:hypothetical protein
MSKGPQGRPKATFENPDKVLNKIKDQKKSKMKQAMTSDDAYRVNLRGGGCAKRGVKKNAYGKNS